MAGFYAEFRRNVHVGKEQHASGEAERAYPERDGQHEHEPYDVYGMEAPGAVEAVTHGGAAEQRAEIVAYRRTGKGDEADSGEGQTAMYGLDGQPVVAHENGVVDDDKNHGKNKLPVPYVKYAVDDFFHAVTLELVVEKPAGQRTDEKNEKLSQNRQIFFHRRQITHPEDTESCHTAEEHF